MGKLIGFDLPKEKDICGVYAIYNKKDNKIYIGQTKNLRERAKAHKNLLEKGKHYINELQKDKNKGLQFYILAESGYCEILEKVYMYECLINGYKLYNTQGMNGKTKEDKRKNILQLIGIHFICIESYEARNNLQKMIKHK